ncbi:unnamed protein product [Sphagnum troendelagicum]|uniref:Uncharacterized protein n=1 Tax=Sphagnum troendelagicum TaxID=128251 RepID=A0ABP0TCK6_9BRYO
MENCGQQPRKRLYNEVYEHTKGDHYATNIVEQIGGSKKTLVMREINEESVSSLLEKRDALADCDVAAFVYDGSNAASWKRAVDLLVEVAAHGEKYGFEVPCLLVAAKDDLEPDPICHQSSIQVCADMGVETPFTNYQRLVQRSLTIAAVGATVSVAGIVLYRVYHARKQQSGS